MFRAPTPSDLPFIKEKVASWSLDPDSLDAGTWLVAADPSGPIAFGRLKPHKDFLELADIGVLPERRKSGIATRLINALLALPRTQPLWLATQIPDFFRKFGFVEDSNAPEALREKISRHCHIDAVTMLYKRS
ncbi:MAG: GNAT family N-acetyltransferase [Elusimicrobia bacterium]|nr:GNAT family N-acetyltransferase [Elusimicrobiota bacterium]